MVGGPGDLSPDEQAMSPETYQGPLGQALVKVLLNTAKGAVDTVRGPAQLSQANPYPYGSEEWHYYEDTREKGARDWGAGAALNLAGASTPFAPSGAVGVFGGRLAATADRGALAKAEEMHAAGAGRKAIWDQTGWFKGGDDKWRFEIPDYHSQMNQSWHDNGLPNGDMSPIAGQLWHKPLYQAYPDLRRITGMTEKTAGEGGSYQPRAHGDARTFGRDEQINIQAPNAPAARSVALHEVQHAIQEREGFASGGSPSMFSQSDDAQLARSALSYRRELEGLDPKLTPKQKDEIIRKRYEDAGAPDWFPSQEARSVAHDVEGNPAETLQKVMELYGTDKSVSGFTPRQLYYELPGEIEARNVQARRDMTPAELKAKPPWETAGMDARPIMSRLFGGGRVGSLEGAAASRGPQMSIPQKPLTEKQFYDRYSQHLDLRGRVGGNADEIASRIAADGFRKSGNVNTMPPYRGGAPRNIVDQKLAPKAGDTVYLVPNSATREMGNGRVINEGWKPESHEILKIEEDYPSLYQAYLKSLAKAQGK
jgi:hypothetical protein